MPCATSSQWSEFLGTDTSGDPLASEELPPNSPLELRTELGSLFSGLNQGSIYIWIYMSLTRIAVGVIQWDIFSWEISN